MNNPEVAWNLFSFFIQISISLLSRRKLYLDVLFFVALRPAPGLFLAS